MSSFEQFTSNSHHKRKKKEQSSDARFRMAKSALHRNLQLFLCKHYSGEDLFMEKKFPSIRRTADLVLLKQKKVFEVQTSLIGIKELLERERDYRSLGYEVTWILYDKIFLCEPPLLVTRVFYSKNTYYFSFHNDELFLFRNLDLEPVPVDLFFRPDPFYKKCLRFFLGFL
jgi:competence CoiA-like predicted nuclease